MENAFHYCIDLNNGDRVLPILLWFSKICDFQNTEKIFFNKNRKTRKN